MLDEKRAAVAAILWPVSCLSENRALFGQFLATDRRIFSRILTFAPDTNIAAVSMQSAVSMRPVKSRLAREIDAPSGSTYIGRLSARICYAVGLFGV
jgi:hypothetical protein